MISLSTRLAALAALALCMAFVPAASAAVTANPYGNTTDARTGGHGDLTTGVTFNYGGNSSETVRRILTDNPAGGVGNPNAVPFADRCTKKQFETSTCGVKSQLGEVTISAQAWVIPGILGVPLNDMVGTISQIQTDPEVPTLVGAYVQPKLLGLPTGDPIRAYARFYPVTSGPDGDFRIRSETDPFPKTSKLAILGFQLAELPIQITKYQQRLFGKLANGNVFLTNPTRCDTWYSYGYAEFYDSNAGANYDPFQTGSNRFFRANAVPTTPDCKTLAPFNVEADSTVSGSERGGRASYTTELKIAGLGGAPIGAATPKTVVATLPDAVTIDVAQLGRICSNEDFAAFKCPASTQVGTASVSTPMIAAGLQGKAYMVKASPGRNLPDLGIHITGALEFNIRGTNRFVNITQVQTTFDNIPQIGFSSFKLNVTGGPNSLLIVDKCPSDGSEPVDGGPTRFDMTSYQGQVLGKNSPSVYTPPSCINYSVTVKNVNQCVKKRSLTIKPSIRSRSEVRFVKYYVNGKYAKQVSRSPFGTTLKLSKQLKAGKTYRYKVKVYYKPSDAYPNGRVTTKTAKFKICR